MTKTKLTNELLEKIKNFTHTASGVTLGSDQDFDELDEGFEGYRLLEFHQHGHAMLEKKLTDGSTVIDLLIVGENDDPIILNVSDYDDAVHLFNALTLAV